jgi:hypothetical protein
MITVTLTKDRARRFFVCEPGSRLDFGISNCGYITIYEGNQCIYKASLSEIRSVYVSTKEGGVVVYKKGSSR